MKRYKSNIVEEVRRLRGLGKTYGEIKELLQLRIPKSTLSDWCKSISLPQDYGARIIQLNIDNLNKARLIAFKVNKIKRDDFLEGIEKKNTPVSKLIHSSETAKIALAMLCLGEASKSTRRTSFYLGNSDPKIIILFLKLLERCFDFNQEKIRCTVQCRADQNIEELEKFWLSVTQLPKRLFYKARIDPRTIGKPTQSKDYKGVLRIDYFDTKVRLELESLSNLVYNQLLKPGPVA